MNYKLLISIILIFKTKNTKTGNRVNFNCEYIIKIVKRS
jgi:hypothetical protein